MENIVSYEVKNFKDVTAVECPYQVFVKINIHNNDFKQKISNLTDHVSRYELVWFESIFSNIFRSKENKKIGVNLIIANQKYSNVQYLQDYISSGSIFKFSNYLYAEQFSELVVPALEKVIDPLVIHFQQSLDTNYGDNSHR